jgi:hypothetical protein
MFADSKNIFNRWKNLFPQLLNVHGVYDFRHIKMHTAKSLVPESNPFEIETATEMLQS